MPQKLNVLALLIIFCLFLPKKLLAAQGPVWGPSLAQVEEGDDSYDPFADYSEFDESSDEEADINFFRNGRLLTVGLSLGVRSFTQQMNSLYQSSPAFGLFLSYFFDLRLALQFGFLTGDHAYALQVPGYDPLLANVSFSSFSFNMKYFMNTQNVTNGLAALSPYIIGGLSQHYRTIVYNVTLDNSAKDATVGVDFGLGVEIPLNRKRSYLGLQWTYHYFNFKDENTPIEHPTAGTTNVTAKGDAWDVLAIIGMNF